MSVTNAHAHGTIGEHEHEGGAIDHVHEPDGAATALDELAAPVPEEQRPSFSMALAIIGQDAQPADIEAFIAALPAPLIPWWVKRLKAIEKAAGDVADRLELEWGARAGGLSWRDAETGDWYDYKGSSRGAFKEVPDLVAQLEKAGLSRTTIAGAISGMRITDLEEAADAITAKIGLCQSCGEYVPLDEIASGGHTVAEHAGDVSCRVEDRHANCPVPALCGPVDEVPKSEYLRAIIREHYSYSSGPKHLTKREERPARRRQKDVTK